ncbi:penicillin-binding protein 2 [Rhodovulum sulfidophilum]|uniref:peptidoglycan D,D-transpeptidase FtsI family protein n=1 Tax=Rhodovulum sulfidophilum TaxID=35806 RepID=UPI001920E346|nr:penicillin-binding protein 2 [Rhodovulum sulfidophilum]MBL3574096.1 penicillin-binding protein 2 [Rhodovulum sulfidophilum]MCE8432155.1 penicillin-binding protein 2 [Rhodovulum sulfidophilum]MCF4117502.1 penicillin-binding protein 2 [Rhodovulum sulfidophilum]
MIRTPLRPLARILEARAKGENPDAIERENKRLRHEKMRDQARVRAEGRLLVLGVVFCAAFAVVGVRMGLLAGSVPSEPRATAPGASIVAQRADIVDRNGNILATNLATHSLYAQPPLMIDPKAVARELARIFPDLDEARMVKDFTGSRKFVWIKKKISPEQMQLVHDIGDPGLSFGPREMRLYPNGALAAHILGGAGFGREGVQSAEVIGVAGVERYFDDYLRDPANGGQPLRLSLDLTVQAAVERVLAGGMKLMNAKGAAAILMDVHSGEILSMVSLPDFDPNERPRQLVKGDPSDSPLFNRAVQGVYELGSTFKTLTLSQALEEGIVTPNTMIDTKGPLVWGRFRIHDFHNYGSSLSVTTVLVKSSNIGTARIAQRIGGERQRAFLSRLGLLDPSPVELVEAAGAKPLLPANWSELSTMTISYGHGVSTSPLNLAAAYSTVANGGRLVRPTLRAGGGRLGARVISEETSRQIRKMLREVVVHGTASFGEVPGYRVGGKTGTADKPKPTGGYYDKKVIATFASMFPAEAPQYVLIVTLDEPQDTTGPKPRRTAGWTAVPVAAEIIRRAAPLLGLRPEIEQAPGFGVTLTAN